MDSDLSNSFSSPVEETNYYANQFSCDEWQQIKGAQNNWASSTEEICQSVWGERHSTGTDYEGFNKPGNQEYRERCVDAFKQRQKDDWGW